MKNNLRQIQVSDSLGNLVDAVNALVRTMQSSDEKVGNLDYLETIDTSNIVAAVNSLSTQLKTMIGSGSYFDSKSVQARFIELENGLGELSQYDYLQDTNLLSVIDKVLVLLSEASGDSSNITERFEELDERLAERSRERIVSAEEFGIVSSSTEDQTEKVLELFNHATAAGANVVYFPPGIFRFRPLRLSISNMVIRGAGRRTIFRQSNNSTSPLLQFSGSTERAATVSPVKWGDTVVKSSQFAGSLEAGDFVRVVGRVSLSNLTAPELSGELTVGAEESSPVKDYYYSEFNQVSSLKTSDGELTLRSGVNSNTLSSTAPALIRYNFRTGVVIKDLSFEQSTDYSQFLGLEAVKDFTIENVHIRGARSSTQIVVNNSLNVNISNTVIEYVNAAQASKGILVNSSENCIIEGGAVRNAGMGVCVQSTGGTGVANVPVGLISRSNTVKSVEITNSLVAGVHEVATHDTTVTNCNIRGTHGQGVFSTGRRIRVEGSTIQTSRMEAIDDGGEGADYVKVEEVGVSIFGAGSQDGVVTGNTIEGSVYGVQETGPIFRPKDHSGLKIIGNSIINCFRGVVLQRPAGKVGPEGVNNNFFNTTIIGNTFRATNTVGQIPIHVNFYVNGFQIIGNSFFGNEVSPRCISLSGYFDYVVVTGNSAIGFTEDQHIYLGLRYDGKAPNLIIDGNIGNFNISGMLGRMSRTYDRKNMSIIPSNDNWFDLGLSTARWRDVYLRNSPTVTSDRNAKTEISGEDLGLDFVEKLNPVSYKLKENQSGRRHHGLIAQEVEQALKDIGVDVADHGGVVVDADGNYSLRYEEFTSSLILAVQELSERIKKLENNQK